MLRPLTLGGCFYSFEGPGTRNEGALDLGPEDGDLGNRLFLGTGQTPQSGSGWVTKLGRCCPLRVFRVGYVGRIQPSKRLFGTLEVGSSFPLLGTNAGFVMEMDAGHSCPPPDWSQKKAMICGH